VNSRESRDSGRGPCDWVTNGRTALFSLITRLAVSALGGVSIPCRYARTVLGH
jgi:hypothetical protein